MMTKKTSRGFTLIELMITIAIIGILARIAYPAYTSSALKGRRAEGRTAILQLLQQQERYMTQNGTYLVFANPACATNTIPFKTFSGDVCASAKYQLSTDACPGTTTGTTLSVRECIRVTATPASTDADAGNLQMTSTGTKTCTGTNSSVCWN
jgi:type IV pilus assembly protein PilE